MTSSLDITQPKSSRGDRIRGRALGREFFAPMLAYCAVLALVVVFGDLHGHSSWRILWALLPVFPLGWALRAVLRHVRRVDEFQQRLLLQGLAVGFAASMLASITVGFLGIAGLDMRFAGWIVYGVGMLAWIIGAAGAAAVGQQA